MRDLGRVIDLRTRSTYMPDCANLARNRLVLARRSLDMTVAEFAAMLTPVVGWPVTSEAVAAWETTLVPPGDVLVAVSSITPMATSQLGVRSHKFIAAHIDGDTASKLSQQATPVEHPTGQCTLHVWPFGAAIYHLVEDLDLPDIASLAIWRYRSYEDNLSWATGHLRSATGGQHAASYVLSLYWVHSPTWVGRMLDTALRIICAPRVLLERNITDAEESLCAAEQAERTLLAEGFDHDQMRAFGVKGVSAGYASWSGVVYHPIDPARALPEEDLVRCELATQSLWAYCEHINRQVEQSRDPQITSEYGWRFLRAAKSRLTIPRPQETGQHRSMREAIVETSGLPDHLTQAIEALREAG